MAAGTRGGLAGLRALPPSALRVLVLGIGFVVLVGAAFTGVGAWQDRDTTATETAAPEPEPEPEPAPAPEPAPEPEPEPEPEPDPEPEPVDDGPQPADVTVQLLNGAGDGGAAVVADARATLTDAGFRIAASNNARPYDTTTIFYTVGFESEARLVGEALGVTEINPMTDLPPERRLSDGVMVHVVLGADRR